jgi:hypothetical protein
MKRVYLRVLENGDILTRRGGDNESSEIIPGSTERCDGCGGYHDGAPDGKPVEVDGDLGTAKVLPFYAMTDREEAELLVGRAFTERCLAEDALKAQFAKIDALKAEEAKLDGKLSLVVVSHSATPPRGVAAGFALTERLDAEKAIPALALAVDRARAKLDAASTNAHEAAKAEASKSASAQRGAIPADFGKH